MNLKTLNNKCASVYTDASVELRDRIYTLIWVQIHLDVHNLARTSSNDNGCYQGSPDLGHLSVNARDDAIQSGVQDMRHSACFHMWRLVCSV